MYWSGTSSVFNKLRLDGCSIIGVEIVIGVADEEVFAAAMDPRQLIMYNDNPVFHHCHLYQYWASSFLAALVDD